MRVLLRSRYPRRKTFLLKDSQKYELLDAFGQMSQAQRDDFRLVLGHQANKLANLLTEPLVLTFLRDPVSRVVSLYYYARDLRLNHPRHEITTRLSLQQLFQEGVHKEWSELADGQYKSLMSWDVFAELSSRHSFDETFEELVLGKSPRLFIGLMESFDESLILLQRCLGWTRYPYYQKKNANKPKHSGPGLPEETRAIIVENNATDIKLYEAAKRIYKRHLEQQGVQSVSDDLARFRDRNKFFGQIEGMRHLVGRVFERLSGDR